MVGRQLLMKESSVLCFGVLFSVMQIAMALGRKCNIAVPDTFRQEECKKPIHGDNIICNESLYTTLRTKLIHNVCSKTFRATKIRLVPHADLMKIELETMIKRCCRRCHLFSVDTRVPRMSNIKFFANDSTDIVFPVVGTNPGEGVYGYYFLPLMNAPSVYYVTMLPTSVQQSQILARGCQNLWPLVATALVFAVISGFIAWWLETRINTEEFPRPFYAGLFEGFWWSFITMTTVGYGDKAPRSYSGKIFAVVWIMAGITIFSMSTASLTKVIGDLSTPSVTMEGEHVGALSHRLLDSWIIARHGGRLHTIEDDDGFEHGIERMIKMVTEDELIKGFVIDKITYLHYRGNENNTWPTRKLIATEKQHGEEKVYFGALMKNKTDFEYFKSYFENNRLQLEACANFRFNTKLSNLSPNEFLLDPKSKVFENILLTAGSTLALILVFGLLLELKRYWNSKTQRNVERDTHEADGNAPQSQINLRYI